MPEQKRVSCSTAPAILCPCVSKKNSHAEPQEPTHSNWARICVSQRHQRWTLPTCDVVSNRALACYKAYCGLCKMRNAAFPATAARLSYQNQSSAESLLHRWYPMLEDFWYMLYDAGFVVSALTSGPCCKIWMFLHALTSHSCYVLLEELIEVLECKKNIVYNLYCCTIKLHGKMYSDMSMVLFILQRAPGKNRHLHSLLTLNNI